MQRYERKIQSMQKVGFVAFVDGFCIDYRLIIDIASYTTSVPSSKRTERYYRNDTTEVVLRDK
jgi:hypothetical protein